MAAATLAKLRTYASDLEQERKKRTRTTDNSRAPAPPLKQAAKKSSAAVAVPAPTAAPINPPLVATPPVIATPPSVSPTATPTPTTTPSTPLPVREKITVPPPIHVEKKNATPVPAPVPPPKPKAVTSPIVAKKPEPVKPIVVVQKSTPEAATPKKEKATVLPTPPAAKPTITATIHKAAPDTNKPTTITTNTKGEVRDASYPATVIKDTKRKRFSLSRAIVDGMSDWWKALKIARTKQDNSILTAPPLSRQRGLTAGGVVSGPATMADHEAVIARLKKTTTYNPAPTPALPTPDLIPLPTWETATTTKLETPSRETTAASKTTDVHTKPATIVATQSTPKKSEPVTTPTHTPTTPVTATPSVPVIVSTTKTETVVPPLIPPPKKEVPAPVTPSPKDVPSTPPRTVEVQEVHDVTPVATPVITPIVPKAMWHDQETGSINNLLAADMGTFYDDSPTSQTVNNTEEEADEDEHLLDITPAASERSTATFHDTTLSEEIEDIWSAVSNRDVTEFETDYDDVSTDSIQEPELVPEADNVYTDIDDVVDDTRDVIETSESETSTPTPVVTPIEIRPQRIEPIIPPLPNTTTADVALVTPTWKPVESVMTVPAPEPVVEPVPPVTPSVPVTPLTVSPSPVTAPLAAPTVTLLPKKTSLLDNHFVRRIVRVVAIGIIMLTLGVVGYIVVRGSGVSFDWRLFSSSDTAPSDVSRYISGSIQHTVVPTLITKENIMRQIAGAKEEGEVVSEITLLTTYAGDPIAGRTIAELLNFSLPTAYRGNITDVTFGYYHNDPWLIVAFTDTTSARGAMLKWESTIGSDLAPFFPITKVGKNPEFIDDMSADTDVRILRNTDNEEQVVYGFIRTNTILITTNSTSFLNLFVNQR